MARILRRISPRRTSGPDNCPEVSAFAQTADMRDGRTIRIDHASPPSRGSVSTETVEEELLNTVRECSQAIESLSVDLGAPTRNESAALPNTATIGDHGNPKNNAGPTPRAEVRVQLRLSTQLIRILNAFRKAGKNPRRIVESSLWNDPRIRDAAAILRLDREESEAAPG